METGRHGAGAQQGPADGPQLGRVRHSERRRRHAAARHGQPSTGVHQRGRRHARQNRLTIITSAVLRLQCSIDRISGSVGHQQNIVRSFSHCRRFF